MRSYVGYNNPTPRPTTPVPTQSQVYGYNAHNLSMRSYSAEPVDYLDDPRYQPEYHPRMYTENVRSQSPMNMTYTSYHN